MVTRTQKKRKISSAKARLAPCKLLPIDIQLLILDELAGSLLDTANAIDAFHWDFPDKLFRQRLPLDLIFELDGVHSDVFDWRCVFIEFCRLMDSSCALVNRKRVLTVVRAVCDEVSSRLLSCGGWSRQMIVENKRIS